MVYKQFDDITIQVEFLNIKIFALIWQLDNIMNKCYNSKMLKKMIMQIKR